MFCGDLSISVGMDVDAEFDSGSEGELIKQQYINFYRLQV